MNNKKKEKGILPLKRTKLERNLNCNYVKLFSTDHVSYVNIWFCVILLNNLLTEGTQWHQTMSLELAKEKNDHKLCLESIFIRRLIV